MACPVRNGASKTRGCRNPSVEPWAGMLQEGSQLNAGKARERLSNLPQCSSGQFSGPVSDRNSQNRTRCLLGNPSWLHPHGLQPWGMDVDVDVCFHCSCCCSFWQGAGGTATCWGGHCCLMCEYSTGDWEQCVGWPRGSSRISDGSSGCLHLNCSKAFGVASDLCSHRRVRMLCSGWVKSVG